MAFSRQEKDLLGAGNVRVVIPQNNVASLQEVLQDDESEATSIVDIQQRDILFFDERLKVYVVLQLPEVPEHELKSYLSRLELHLEVWVTEKSNLSPNATSARDLIHTHKVKHEDDPFVLVSQDEDSNDDLYLNLIWETTVVLHRPRIRLSEPHVVIVPIATIAPVEEDETGTNFLAPYQAPEHNLLEPLRGSKGFEGEVPFFPASRLYTIVPRAPKEDHSFHIPNTPTSAIRTQPVGITRLKHSKVTTHGASLSVLTTLDVEIIPYVDVQGSIDRAELKLRDGKVEHLMEHFMPIDFVSRDCIALLFRLHAPDGTDRKPSTRHSTDGDNGNLSFMLDITLNLTADCKPDIKMEWITDGDLFQNAKQAYMGQNLSHGPNSMFDLAATKPKASLPANYHNTIKTVSISFAGSQEVIKIGEPFTWKVFISNKSSRTVKLAIIPLPRLQRTSTQAQQHMKRHVPKSSSISIRHGENAQTFRDEDIAPAVVDENVLYAMHHSGTIQPDTDLLSLTPELRIGPLGAGQSHEGIIQMVAFKKGALVVDAIRVVDLVKESEHGPGTPGVITDIHDLPDVIVE